MRDNTETAKLTALGRVALSRRQLLTIVLASGGTSLLAACGQASQPAPTSVPAAAQPTQAPKPVVPTSAAAATVAPVAQPTRAAPVQATGGNVSLTYAFWDAGQKPSMDAQIAAFQAKNPNIAVESQVIPFSEYWTKLQTAAAGGSAFDVFWMNGPRFPTFASRGVLLDLQGKLGDLDLNAYPKSLQELYTFQGKLYAVPKDFDTIGLFYNKALFDGANLPVPTADWTWNDLRDVARKLTSREKGQWGFNPTPTSQECFLSFIAQNGGKFLSDDGTKCVMDQPPAIEAFSYLHGFIDDGSSPSPAEQQANSADWEPGGKLFPSGKIAMVTSGSWNAKSFHDGAATIDAAPLPKGKQKASVIHGLGQVVWAKSPHQAEAVEFVKFLGSKEAQQILGEKGTVIPAMQGFEDTWAKSVPGMNLKPFLDAVEYSVPLPATPRGAEWLGKFEETLRDGWLANAAIDQAVQKATQAANDALAKG